MMPLAPSSETVSESPFLRHAMAIWLRKLGSASRNPRQLVRFVADHAFRTSESSRELVRTLGRSFVSGAEMIICAAWDWC